MKGKHLAVVLLSLGFAAPGVARAQSPSTPAPGHKRVVEEIVARVNNEIITLSDLHRAQLTLRREVEEDCRGCTPQQINEQLRKREGDVLRDLIDTSLLAQRGKDLGLNVEADVVKQMDVIRQRNNIASLEDLCKVIESQDISCDDFKNQIRNNILTQQVMQREVGSRMIISKEEVADYYSKHMDEFHRPEQVALSEIFVSTQGKPEAEIPALEQKARGLLERVKKGEDFGEIAKRFSDGSTAQQGGELGVFKRGELAKELEEVVFKLNRGQMTDVIRTQTGFLVLRVEQRYEEGLQPMEKVEPEIQNRIYYQKMQPSMREYLTKLRRESYVMVKPGYMDTAGVESRPIVEVQPQAEEEKGKKKGKAKKDKKSSE